jgi:hypothetical protein
VGTEFRMQVAESLRSVLSSKPLRSLVSFESRLKLGILEMPVILCDEWTPTQVKAFRLVVNRSVTWAEWDEELLALELQEIQASDFDLSLTGFEDGELAQQLAFRMSGQTSPTGKFTRHIATT